MKQVPTHLKSTLDLLNRAFPRGLSEPEYKAVLALLYPHLSDRNLAEVVCAFTGRDIALVRNDVLAAGGKPESPETDRVQELLSEAGFEEWSREP